MARFQVLVCSVEAGGAFVPEVSETGDETLWVRREPGELFSVQRVTESESGERVFDAVKLLSAEQSRQLREAIDGMPPGRTFACEISDGPRFRLILALPQRVEQYFWGPRRDPDPEFEPVSRLIGPLWDFAGSG